MPIYEYICAKCNEKFSLLQSVHSSENDVKCPKCSSKPVKKVMSVFCCAPGNDTGFSSPVPSGNFSGGG